MLVCQPILSFVSFAHLSSYLPSLLTPLPAGPNSVIEAISISSHVHVGENCVLQPFCIIKENVKILPHTIVPANMVVASNSVVGGRPGRVVGEVGEGWGVAAASAGAGGTGEPWVEGGDLRELVRSIK